MADIKVKYSVYGILFGLMFPVMACVFECIRLSLDINFSSIILIHEKNPLLYIIDSAPIWLGLFALIGGVSKAKSVELLKSIKTLTNTLKENSNELKQNSMFEFQNLNNQANNLSQTLASASFQMQEVDSLIGEMSGQATTLKKDADEIISNTQKLIRLNNNLKSANDDLSVIITNFISKVKDMENYLNKVATLGVEINTLSINSSIEAYKMGIKGSSFSVIALNIKNISEQLSKINLIISGINKQVEDDINNISNRISDKNNILEENGTASSFIDQRINSYQFQLSQLISNVEILSSANRKQKQNFEVVNSSFNNVLDSKENMMISMDDLMKKEFVMIKQLSQ
jgi:methyl-accepting chemotaxis protein